MPRELVISHPHMGNYAIVLRQLFRHLFPEAKVLIPPPTTQKTLDLGNKYSPDFVCAPFKYNLGNYIEALEQGANVLFQTGTGCRYGYYGELQEQILHDLGYDFNFVCLSREHLRADKAVKLLRDNGCTLSVPKIAHAFLLTAHSLYIMDRFEYWLRENIGFEVEEGSCERVWNRLLDDIGRADSHRQLLAAQYRCKWASLKIKFNKPKDPLRVGIVGELFTLMEPFATFELEKQLAREGMVISRVMSAWYLIFARRPKRMLGQCGCYLDYEVGANGVDSIAQSLAYAKRHYDGILHLKSFGCIPELNCTPAMLNLSRQEKIPLLELSFDMQSSEAGVQTRIEAFADMLRMRKGA